MSPYRAPAPRPRWFVEAQVRGPLSSFLMGALIEALDEQEAEETYVKQMTDAGFTILSEVRAARST
jgi:hypothetical protein